MSTLADELLQDFEDSGSENENEERQDDELGVAPSASGGLLGNGNGLNDMDVDNADGAEDDDEEMNGIPRSASDAVEDAEDAKAKVEKMQLGAVDDVRSVASLMQTLEPVLEKIAQYQSQPAASRVIGNIEDHPEYHLLTQSNSLSTLIDGEIILVHKYIRDHYSIRFPELETLITNPVEYAKVVSILGNGPLDSENIKALQTSTDNPLKSTLKSVLDGPSLMIVTVEATRARVATCRMNLFAPNLTVLIGSLTAAQLLNAAGGLTGLSKTPACNIAAWGSKKGAGAAGMATNIGIRQQGFLYHSSIVQGIPNDLKKQAMRIVSAKLVLAARVDRIHSSPDGATGEELKSACLERLEKLTEPPPNKGARALPAPDEKLSRKRGGRRARKAKEATAMTELRKAQNRMAFGKEEREVGYGTGEGTVGMGMIGQGSEGKIRNLQVDQRTRAKLSAKNKGWGAASSLGGAASSFRGFGQAGASSMDLRGKGLRTSGVGSSLGGTGTGVASSLAFTPVQGLELVDPKMQAELSRKRKAEEDRWFKGGTFTQVGGADTSAGGGFKKPGQPPSKKAKTGAGMMAPPPRKT
ncbi:pre-mRNA-processing factor 31 [Verticillium alfalfae VaMs.102]|uniref:Pre-mRNA-processing factor 31 n=1 Tax=Verticillium alfalfae (strain VaMs.102 / ATCC MYA-4576 / FGSC 10136) TaxID=526221 RepID=C9SJY9_VERA1|nr:pre-mRNA-processing factor 31 [Verticillium alfalfae VaMs.102]EEY19007.1 pre-mRNA-processing factor 31 [Verticillium alfalfae VaMs.102]